VTASSWCRTRPDRQMQLGNREWDAQFPTSISISLGKINVNVTARKGPAASQPGLIQQQERWNGIFDCDEHDVRESPPEEASKTSTSHVGRHVDLGRLDTTHLFVDFMTCRWMDLLLLPTGAALLWILAEV